MTLPVCLDDVERRKLVGLCGRFGSDNDNERATAARLAHRFVLARGLSWAELIAKPAHGHDPDHVAHEIASELEVPQSPTRIAAQLLRFPLWTEWEREFLAAMHERGDWRDGPSFRPLSDKQAATLRRLWRRWKQAEEAANA